MRNYYNNDYEKGYKDGREMALKELNEEFNNLSFNKADEILRTVFDKKESKDKIIYSGEFLKIQFDKEENRITNGDVYLISANKLLSKKSRFSTLQFELKVVKDASKFADKNFLFYLQ